jgi:hypothetical protein
MTAASVKRFCHKAKQTLCGQSVIAVGKKHLRGRNLKLTFPMLKIEIYDAATMVRTSLS